MLFSTESYFRRRFAAEGRRDRFAGSSAAEARAWHEGFRRKLRTLVGLDRMEATDPAPRTTDVTQCDGYRRERVEIDTEPGVTMPFYVLVPDGLTDTAPAVLALHGHLSGGKYAPAGRGDVAEAVANAIRLRNYDYGVQAVRRGFVVFCPDARGFGERREAEDGDPSRLMEASCRHLAHMGLPLGLTVAGMWTWDLMVLLGYVASRSETRGRRIGCIGFSGGGLQTLYLTALDDRVDCAVISGYFYGVDDSLLHLSSHCDCNYVPGLWQAADMADIAGLIAPRPLLIEAARQDPLNGPRGIRNVEEQVEILSRVYDALGASDRLALDAFEGDHVWHGTDSMAWLDTHLKAA